jgi:hypothetical protein
VHWVRPELVAEVKFLTWTDDNLLRQVVSARGQAGGRGSAPHTAPEARREVESGPLDKGGWVESTLKLETRQ